MSTENMNLKEMATMNRKFVTAANKRAKEEVEPAVSGKLFYPHNAHEHLDYVEIILWILGGGGGVSHSF